ncbi:MAG: hypothetical protein ACOCQR_00745 [bacterium]
MAMANKLVDVVKKMGAKGNSLVLLVRAEILDDGIWYEQGYKNLINAITNQFGVNFDDYKDEFKELEEIAERRRKNHWVEKLTDQERQNLIIAYSNYLEANNATRVEGWIPESMKDFFEKRNEIGWDEFWQ